MIASNKYMGKAFEMKGHLVEKVRRKEHLGFKPDFTIKNYA